jgi:hypothetical protein
MEIMIDGVLMRINMMWRDQLCANFVSIHLQNLFTTSNSDRRQRNCVSATFSGR